MIHLECGGAEPMSRFACHGDMDGVNLTLPNAKAAPSDQYGPDVLCASWIPSVADAADDVRARPESVTGTADADAFLPRFYRAQQG